MRPARYRVFHDHDFGEALNTSKSALLPYHGMSLPPEVIAAILEYLPRKTLKEARLVCKTWSELCLLHLHFNTVYLSPRDKDMEVFDGMTQSDALKSRIKHLVFDSTQFVHLSKRDYISIFLADLEYVANLILSDEEEPDVEAEGEDRQHADNEQEANSDERSQARALIYLLNEPLSASDYKIFHIEHAHERFQDDESLMDGFHQYSRLVDQQANIMSKAWLHRACQGLEVIDVEKVTVCSAWSKMHVEGNAGSGRIDPENEIESDDNDWNELFGDVRPKEKYQHPHLLGEDGPDLLWREDDYSGLSPVARSWPSTCLLPVGPMYPLSCPKRAMQTMGISDGCFEILKLGQLLNAAGKEPWEIRLPGGWGNTEGISPMTFSLQRWPSSSHLFSVCSRLEILEVNLTPYEGCWHSDGSPHLEGLRAIIQTSAELRELSLKSPFDPSDPEEGDRADSDFYLLSRIVPSAAGWQSSRITKLNISGLSVSYEGFADLLFLTLPNLKKLQLGFLQLRDGCWDDFVEGLRQQSTLESCWIGEPLLYANNSYYLVNESNPEEWYEVLSALSDYINNGGRHPSLLDHERDTASSKYSVQLHNTLHELRSSRKKLNSQE